MNSQELEQSLKAEFESHLNTVVAEMKQELAAFQGAIQSELEQQRSRMDEAFQGFKQRIELRSELGGGFSELVSEHLKLARDEGARLAATAYSEAEMITSRAEETAAAAVAAPADYAGLRNAISEISSKDSQAAILTALVENAGQFAARGAFFIVKNERFLGWKTFGEAGAGEHAISNVSLSTAENSILGRASQSTQSVESSHGAHDSDAAFLGPLQFGEPDRMYAVPLVVRGRSVAVLYADGGPDGTEPNREALEMLLRVAGMTVELLASGVAPAAEEQAYAPAPAEPGSEETPNAEPSFESEQPETVPMEGGPQYSEEFQQEIPQFETVSREEEAPVQHEAVSEPAYEAEQPAAFEEERSANQPEEWSQPAAYQEEQPASQAEEWSQPAYQETPEPSYDVAPQPASEESIEPAYEEAPQASFEDRHEPVAEEAPAPVEEAPAFFQEPEQEEVREEQPQYQPEPAPVYEPAASFEAPQAVEPAPEPEPALPSPFERTVMPFEPAVPIGAGVGAHVLDQPVEVTSPPVPRGRLSDRHVDLPIEVPEEDRRMHNDARRFARLLVSEIKLYNEKKVLEGRQAADLYGRLREAIDRSREMYDKRVQPPVAAKFDYFHYELVNSLAEGDAAKFGAGYPGAAV